MDSNIPDDLKAHGYTGKYQLVTEDKELGVPLYDEGRGFVVDALRHPFLSPHLFNSDYDAFENLSHHTMEEGDYLLSCPMKTGQHWAFEIMSMLLAGEAKYVAHGKEASWFDIAPTEKLYKEHKKPRVLCTHITPGWLPEGLLRPDTKAVVTMRNLKDTFVSYHCFLKSIRSTYCPRSPPPPEEPHYWATRFKTLMYSKHVYYGNLFDVFADSWDAAEHSENVHIVFYENLKMDPCPEIEKLAKFMGVAYTQELISEIAEAVQMGKMKEGKKHSSMSIDELKQLNVYRKGEVGDWKNWFTVAQNEEFHRKFDEWNKERQIPMLFE